MLNYAESRPTKGTALDVEGLSTMLKALSDPNRLQIFDLLMTGTHCNCEIAEQLDLSLSLVSHHLRVLRDAGLIQSERAPEDARWIYYSVEREALAALQAQMAHLLNTKRITERTPCCNRGEDTCG
jgi:ArsR family transcriptional regulator